jgi:hypothetical protein
MQPCSLLSLATAVPRHIISQQDAKVRAREAFGGNKALFDRLSGVFDNAGIAQRHIVAPQEWYMSSHGWHGPERRLSGSRGELVRRGRERRHRKGGSEAKPDRRMW